ncbi:hypothetical protein ACWT_2192 [Actinoplanes sp. SE50]|uniref:LutC/YkgG family protein n=1 Tax=unclassified Actinoplanes TaxID=2626549 RepID=UPI00023ECC6E|nr:MULTISPECIES: LUD domain-containing protein [unclassified Actinoplanes]AEV83212.1 hypothetical protein ACPL_2317 [Actinoplanes sp. SE50/110]ATO81607.1 hypothetical protein ACWT_2192 [Actinoplanes sp. SE50]SLL99015.1 hypothetical protein ACSP50_2243 [Actinoplanes sp. SE50/110]
MSAKDLILGRIRAALRDAPAAPDIPRTYRRDFPAADLELLVDRLLDYRAAVHRIPETAIAATVSGLVRGPVVIPPGLPPSWHPATALIDDDLPRDRIAAAEAVLTAAAVAVAETGTIVLDASPDQGRRIISLLPDIHFVVLRPAQVVASVPEAVARLGAGRPLTWFSGPSATSDIEFNRVEGVHGPRHLHVLLLDGEA